MSIRFEGYERRIDKINKTLAEYGIASLEDAKAVCDAKGIDVEAIVKGVQPIAFENAVWAYTVGCAIAIKKNCKEAQFQIGYKGYLQLAIRTGEYVDIDAIEIREGEYKGRNRLTGKPEFEFVDDDAIRENLPVIGYMAYFEMKNGYIKRLYWSKEKMVKHADEYSQAFSAKKLEELQSGKIPQNELWKYSSFWYKNFDEMAKKTMLRQLLSKHGLLSTEMQKAVESDQAIIDDELKPHYVDNPNVIDNEEQTVPSFDMNQIVPEPVIEPIDDPMA